MRNGSICGRLNRLAPLALTGLLASCGGGGGSGGGGFDAASDLTGIWFGTYHIDFTETDDPAVMMFRANGDFYMDTDLFLVSGRAGTEGTVFTARGDGHTYTNTLANGAEFSLSGNISGHTLTGAFSSSASSGTFTYSRSASLSDLPASLPAIAGMYEGTVWVREVGADGTLTLLANGDLQASSSAGCELKGKVTVAEADHNLYRWTGKLSHCTVNGSGSGVGFALSGGSGVYFVGQVGRAAVFFGSSSPTEPAFSDAGQAPSRPGQRNLQATPSRMHR